MFTWFKMEPADFPMTGYFHFGNVFPEGFRTQFPEAYSITPYTWYNAYKPFASDIMRGTLTGFDREVGNVTDANFRVAHSRRGRFTGSNALYHDGRVVWAKYRYGRRSDTGNYYGYNHPGTTFYVSSYFDHRVDPEPFARLSGPPRQ
jgi:hypothetical protein